MKIHIVSAVLVICVFAGLSPSVFPDETEITEENWMSHPQIVEIRAIVNKIDADLARKIIRQSRTVSGQTVEGLDRKAMIFTDARKTIRKVVSETGTEDSSIRSEFYYDAKGGLRFAFIRAGAVNGASLEQRIYFDAQSTRIWENQRYKSEQRYTFPEKWPDDMIIFSPEITLGGK